MRISSNSYYYQSQYASAQKASQTSEVDDTATTEKLSNQEILEKLKEQIEARASESSGDYGDLYASGQLVKMNIRMRSVEGSEDASKMEAVRSGFDAIKEADLSSLSSEDASQLLTDLQSALTGISSPDGSFEAISQLDVSSMSADEVKEALSSIQTRAKEGPGRPPMGMPPMGPPPGSEEADSAEETSETSTYDTLMKMLERIDEEDNDESLSAIEDVLNQLMTKIAEKKSS